MQSAHQLWAANLWEMTCPRSLCQIGLRNYEKLRQLGGYYFGKSPLVTKQDLFLKCVWELWVVLKITKNPNSHQTNWQYLPTKSRHSKPKSPLNAVPNPCLSSSDASMISFPLLRELRGACLLSSGKIMLCSPKSSPCWIDGICQVWTSAAVSSRKRTPRPWPFWYWKGGGPVKKFQLCKTQWI